MQFGLFYEHQIPRPWNDDDEYRILQESLAQVELADRLGFDYVWEVEHHFLEEYSHSSAPEVFLGACSQRTKRIRLGHGIVLMPPAYNHPARVAERIATLDLVSGGRVEWGTGESASHVELGGFGIDPAAKRGMWEECTREAANMMAQSPYPGYAGNYFSMPARNVVPKPRQKPHPPLWLACSSRETMRNAARHGVGALTFAFVNPEEAKFWVEEYYSVFERECQPIGRAVNPNVAIVAGLLCHENEEVAVQRGLEGLQFFGYGLAHYYFHGSHVPGQTNVFSLCEQGCAKDNKRTGAIGTPEQIRHHLRQAGAIGADQIIFIQQAGRTPHEHICESLELFAAEVMPEFQERHEAQQRAKAERLGAAIAAAEARIVPLPKLDTVTPVDAYPLLKSKRDSTKPSDGLTDVPEVVRRMTAVGVKLDKPNT